MKHERGLTLIEVAIGILVLGLLVAPLMSVYNVYRIDKAMTDSDGNIQVVQSALQKYVLRTGRYPLPGDRTLTAGDACFGREAAGACDVFPLLPCAGVARPICWTTGFKDFQAPVGNDRVIIGDVPFAELGLPKYFIIDGYGRRFTYAVTQALTNDMTFADDEGIIRLLDRNNNDSQSTNDNLHYAVISHGEDGRGAYTLSGTLAGNCAGAGDDLENCDDDGTFTDNFDTIGIGFNAKVTRFASMIVGADYYDDYLGFSVTTAQDLWTRTATITSDVYSRNPGKIRIGPAAVALSAKIEVTGDVMADELDTKRLCEFLGCDPGQFFTTDVITGNPALGSAGAGGIACLSQQGMTGIGNTDEECNFNTLPVALFAGCAAGLWPQGTDAAGNLLCVVP